MAGFSDFVMGAVKGGAQAASEGAQRMGSMKMQLIMDKIERKRERAMAKAKAYRERAAEKRNFIRDLTKEQFKHNLKMKEKAGGPSEPPESRTIYSGDKKILQEWSPEKNSWVNKYEAPASVDQFDEDAYLNWRWKKWLDDSRYSRKTVPEELAKEKRENFRKEYQLLHGQPAENGSANGAPTAGDVSSALGFAGKAASAAAERSGLLADSNGKSNPKPEPSEPDRSVTRGRSVTRDPSQAGGQLPTGIANVQPTAADLQQLRSEIQAGNAERALQQFRRVYGPDATHQAVQELGLNLGG